MQGLFVGATVHLAFLRDLFVCVLLSPLLLMSLRNYPIALLIVLGFLYLALRENQAIIILRLLVLFAFLESALGSVGIDLRNFILYPLCSRFGSLAIWTLISKAFSTRSLVWAHKMSPYVFTAYCSHHLFLKTVYMAIWVPLVGPETDVTYLVWFFLTAPILALIMGIAFVHVASAININLGRMTTGGREPTMQLRVLGARLIRR